MSKTTIKSSEKEETDTRILIRRLVEEICAENDGTYSEPLIALLKLVADPRDPSGTLLTAITPHADLHEGLSCRCKQGSLRASNCSRTSSR